MRTRDKKPDQQGAPEYKRLITIHAGKPKGPVKDHLKIAADVKRLSLSEQELEKASASYGTDIVRYLSNSRTYLIFSGSCIYIYITLLFMVLNCGLQSRL